MASVTCRDDAAQAEWDEYLHVQCSALQAMQDAMTKRLKINDYPRWDYYQDSAELIFSGSDQLPDLVADVEFVGTLPIRPPTRGCGPGRISACWNPFAPVSTPCATSAKNTTTLTSPFPNGQPTSIGALGAYRVPSDNGYIFMLILSAKHRPTV